MTIDHQSSSAMSATRVVGDVTPQERDEIQALVERKSALLELVQSLSGSDDGLVTNDALFEKIVGDIGRTTTRIRQWWAGKAKQYHWTNGPGWQWTVDFETCQVTVHEQVRAKPEVQR